MTQKRTLTGRSSRLLYLNSKKVWILLTEL